MHKLFYIDFPQENFENQMHRYRCAFCKVETTTINGKLEGHKPDCEYRLAMQRSGYELTGETCGSSLKDADDFD